MDVIIIFPLLIIVGAIFLDLLMGDPRWLPHPVVGMGKLISLLEAKWNVGDLFTKHDHCH